MQAEIISIGDELLIGQVVNTNASWMAQKLNEVGVEVRQITNISDTPGEILRALAEAETRCQVILMTGGLGPTRDDITKEVLCRFFDTRLVMDQQVLEGIQSFFDRKGLSMTDLNRDQALVPESCTVVPNPLGTAPGLAFFKEDKLFVAMPGVPYEMKHIMENFVLPELQGKNAGHFILHKTILTQGIGESFLADLIEPWVQSLPPQIKLAYLPSPGIVRLRLSMRGSHKEAMQETLDHHIEALKRRIPEYFWGFDYDKLEKVVGRMLLQKSAWLATAESCTGGFIAHRITSVPGSSAYFKGSVVAYDNSIKQQLLDVPEHVLAQYGAVSAETVEHMALGVAKQLQTDYAIAVSGIAGPQGGTPEKPVGTVWIAVAGPHGVISRRFLFGDERERNILRASTAALAMLHKTLKES